MKINRVKIYGGLQACSSQPKGCISGCYTNRPYWSKLQLAVLKRREKLKKVIQVDKIDQAKVDEIKSAHDDLSKSKDKDKILHLDLTDTTGKKKFTKKGGRRFCDQMLFRRLKHQVRKGYIEINSRIIQYISMEIITHLINNCDQEDSDIMAATKNLLYLSFKMEGEVKETHRGEILSQLNI
ncbi:MAG: hypothetical protein IPG78_04005 [Ignavibacteria bacterium]|nr:hypothetical protein [Ignavibacteria bacterium]